MLSTFSLFGGGVPHGTLLCAVEERGPHITAMEETIPSGPSSSGAPTLGRRHLYECLDALNHPHAGCQEEDELFQSFSSNS